MATRLAERERELLNLNSQLSVLASVDTLSGLANRRAFDSRLNFEWMKAEHERGKLALAMIDIDHFKAFNDTYGHLDGDACLTKVGDVLTQHCRRREGLWRPLRRRGVRADAAGRRRRADGRGRRNDPRRHRGARPSA